MSDNPFSSQIEAELQKPAARLALKLASCRVDVSEEIPPPEVAWEIQELDSEVFRLLGTLGNFSLVKGKAKSKKSFFINMAISTAVGQGLFQQRLRSPLKDNQNHVLYFDTEQSRYHVQKAVRRVCEQVQTAVPTNLDTYGLRKESADERFKLIEHAISTTPNLGFVVIDGVRDLVTSINDEAEASHMSSALLRWSEEYNIHIVVVLHENPGSEKARGHLGTELTNKAETVIALEIDSANEKVSMVRPGACRNEAFSPFAFEIIEGLPVIFEDYDCSAKSSKARFDVLRLDPEAKFQILESALSGSEGLRHSDLVASIESTLNANHPGKYGKSVSKIKELIKDAVERGWLVQAGNRQPYTLGKLSV